LLLAWLRQVIRVLSARDVHPSLHEIPDGRVLLALEHLEYLPLRHAVKVDKVAAKVGLSTSQLNRLFSRYIGHTPKAHLHLRRVSEAKHLLGSGDLPVKEVAFQLGFASQSAFCHWFVREVGCNPRAFAAQAAPPGE
jgi:AraC-like DNA-binding protein